MGTKHGLTIGKFHPFHIGHELMIDFAITQMSTMTIIVSGKESDVIPLSVRVGWLNEKYKTLTKVTIVSVVDESPEVHNVNEQGTVQDINFWCYWLSVFRRVAPNTTHFVSSDHYGSMAATLLGVEWLPVDPTRQTIPISGTQIRSAPYNYYKYIADIAKPYYLKRVAIIGPESTGKSTMTAELAKSYSTIGVHEYGRTISEALDNNLDVNDFSNIVNRQHQLNKLSEKYADGVIFMDTEAYTTYLFSKIYMNDPDTNWILDYANKTQKIDLYILLKPNVEWVDDGTRIMPDELARKEFFDSLLKFMKAHNKNYIIISEDNFPDRCDTAYYAVLNLLKAIYK